MNILLVEVNPYVPPSLPTSLGYLAAVLKKESHQVRILNIGETTLLSMKSLVNLLRDSRPKLVGIAAYQRNMLMIKGLCKAIKCSCPDTKIILGGPQATFMPSESLEALKEVDFICRAEGELVIREVARALEAGPCNRPVAGTTTRLDTDHWEDGEGIQPPEDLDSYPSPFLEQVLDVEGIEEAIMLTSRGCPYRCAFCYTPRAFGRKVRYHSVERVIEEMMWLSRKEVEKFWFADPSFSFNKRRTQELLEGILARGIRARIWLETRADLVDGDLLDLMRRAGVTLIAYGLESASPSVLRRINKDLSLETLKKAIGMTLERGMEVELFSQYGLPGETMEDALQTLEFVRSMVPIKGNTNAQQMRLYFGCPISDEPGNFGIRPLDTTRPPYISIGARYRTDWMTEEEIHKIRDAWKAASMDGGKRLVS